jgi:hypothetical protein
MVITSCGFSTIPDRFGIKGKSPEAKESAGVGVSSGLGVLEKGAFLVALAFPLREGHVTPVVIAGMNF